MRYLDILASVQFGNTGIHMILGSSRQQAVNKSLKRKLNGSLSIIQSSVPRAVS